MVYSHVQLIAPAGEVGQARSAVHVADHFDDKTEVQPEEREADQRPGGRDSQPGAYQSVGRLKLFHRSRLQRYTQPFVSQISTTSTSNIHTMSRKTSLPFIS